MMSAQPPSTYPGGKAPKTKKKALTTKAGRKKKKKKGSDDEAFEDSDDGDFEGQEVDYMSDGSRLGRWEAGGRPASLEEEFTHLLPVLCLNSSSEEELEGKPKVTQQEEGPKGVDEQSESSEESEEEKPPEEDKEEEEEKKVPTPQEKKRKRGGLGFQDFCPSAPSQTPLSEKELRVAMGVSGPDIPSLAPYRQQ